MPLLKRHEIIGSVNKAKFNFEKQRRCENGNEAVQHKLSGSRPEAGSFVHGRVKKKPVFD